MASEIPVGGKGSDERGRVYRNRLPEGLGGGDPESLPAGPLDRNWTL